MHAFARKHTHMHARKCTHTHAHTHTAQVIKDHAAGGQGVRFVAGNTGRLVLCIPPSPGSPHLALTPTHLIPRLERTLQLGLAKIVYIHRT